jgi:AAA15 family ATPase/GTPase
MGHLNKIVINNYRGISYLEFKPRRINVFVGRNNCGKSSIIEAIGFNLSCKTGFNRQYTNFWESVVLNRGYRPDFLINSSSEYSEIICDEYLTKIEYLPSGTFCNTAGDLIYQFFYELFRKQIIKSQYGETRNPIRRLGSDTGELVNRDENIRFYNNGDKDERYEDYFNIEMESNLERFQTYSKLLITGFTDLNKLHSVNTSIYPSIKSERMVSSRLLNSYFYNMTNIDLLSEPVLNTPFLSNFNLQNRLIFDQLHDRLINENRIKRAISLLQEKIGYFVDMRKTDKDYMIFLENQSHPLPMSSMGDGFRGLILLSMLNALLDDGIILLEEPESSLHPGFLNILEDEILQKGQDNQYFISTHSNEFIKNILESSECDDHLDDILIVRIHKKIDTPNPEFDILSGIQAKELIDEIGLDLRGV